MDDIRKFRDAAHDQMVLAKHFPNIEERLKDPFFADCIGVLLLGQYDIYQLCNHLIESNLDMQKYINANLTTTPEET
jgi:hypothetical protein